MADYYSILGVGKTASDAEIKSAYRKKALEWHPDRNKTAEAATKFKEINKAYEVLSDAKKRQLYDQVGHDAFERSGSNSAAGAGSRQGPFSYSYSWGEGGENPFGDFGGYSDPFEIFEQFFGFRSPQGGQRARQREVYSIDLTFEEAVKGIEKEVRMGSTNRKIKIPAGVDNGMRIRFNEFDLVVNVKPHAFFKRDGQDIYYERNISYTMAVLGGVLDVPTLDGNVKIKVKPGTKSGNAVRLGAKGVPYPNSSRRGDQYVVFQIHVPDHVSSKVRKLLEELDKEIS